jgi:glycosyltransferase involved in cell wall biosynthesis
MEKEINTFSFKPMFSVITPVYNIEEQYLRRAVESVFNQVYRNWELCIADDASQEPHVKEVLKRYQKRNERVKVKYLEKNLGISGASNEALSLATGQYAVFLDHDDELSRDSLYEVVRLLNEHPEADIIYTDEDKLTVSSKRLLPVYKPNWDPDLFLTYNYLCHLVVCRRDLVSKVGGFRKGFEGSQDYDLLLRLTELTDKVFHIPKVLYHWRMIPGSAAMKVDAKKEAFEKSKQALRDAMERRDIHAKISEGKTIGTFKVKEIKNPQ